MRASIGEVVNKNGPTSIVRTWQSIVVVPGPRPITRAASSLPNLRFGPCTRIIAIIISLQKGVGSDNGWRSTDADSCLAKI